MVSLKQVFLCWSQDGLTLDLMGGDAEGWPEIRKLIRNGKRLRTHDILDGKLDDCCCRSYVSTSLADAVGV